MGNAQGGGAGGPQKSGWRILKVAANSPCSNVGLVPYFDVLTHVNGQALGNDKSEKQLYHLIADKEHVPTTFTVLSYTTKKSRDVVVTPNRAWGGQGLIGLIIRYDSFENADCDTFHVLDIHPGSPAEKAGLTAHTDYLLGTADICFKGNDDLDFFITKYNGVPTTLFVYNAQTRKVREVTITVNSKWGGKGALGCDVGWGILHRLPLRDVADVSVEGAVVLPSAGAAAAAAAAVPLSTGAAAVSGESKAEAFPPAALFAVAGGVVLRLRIGTGEPRPLEIDLRIDTSGGAAPAAPAPAPAPAAALPYRQPAAVAVAPPAAVPTPAPAVVFASASSAPQYPAAPYTAAPTSVAAAALPVVAPVSPKAAPVAAAAADAAPVHTTPVRPAVAAAAPAPAPAVAAVASPAPAVAPAAAAASPVSVTAGATAAFSPAAFNAAAFASPYRPFAPAGAAAAVPGTASGAPAFAAFNPAPFTPAPFTPAPFTPKPFVPFQFTPFNPAALGASPLGAGAPIAAAPKPNNNS